MMYDESTIPQVSLQTIKLGGQRLVLHENQVQLDKYSIK